MKGRNELSVNYEALGLRIKELRNHFGYSQDQLAEKLSITRSYLAKIESGTRYPSLDVLLVIAELFNMTLEELLSERCSDALLLSETDFRTLLSNCNSEELKALMRILVFMKELLSDYGI